MSQIIKSKECRHSTYCAPPDRGMPDLHVTKEVLHLEDGTVKTNLAFMRDFRRDFYVAKKGCRNYEDKREWTNIDELIKSECTQTSLPFAVARALGKAGARADMRSLGDSPYLYGSDISSTAIIKKKYQDKYKEFQTKYTVAVFDTETDVLFGTNEIIMASLTFKGTVFTAVVKNFLDGIANVQERVDAAMTKYLGDIVEKRGIKSELVIVDTPMQAVKACFDVAHKLQPDFVTMWNMDFDITKILDACDLEAIDPASIFSAPEVPKEYQFFKYKQGKKVKVTASGKSTPIKPAAQWHVATAPASFTLIDSMCVYKQVRTGKPEEQSYSLDAILNKELGIRKLKFSEADHVERLQWHELMQQSYKIEYIIYNRFDCISVEMLDEKTNDLSLSMPMFSGCSDFAIFNSQPRRMVDRLHWYCLQKGKVIGTTGSDMKEEEDEMVLGLDGWIVTLAAALIADNGLAVIEEYPDLHTRLRAFVGD